MNNTGTGGCTHSLLGANPVLLYYFIFYKSDVVPSILYAATDRQADEHVGT